MKIFVLLVAIVLLGGAAVAGVLLSHDDDDGGGSDGEGFDAGNQLRGVAVLLDEPGDVEGSWDSCSGTGGYEDFSAGMRIAIKGSEGEIVGSGTVMNVNDDLLGTLAEMNDDVGWWSPDEELSASDVKSSLQEGEGIGCVLYFEADIKDSDFYAIELGSRGDLSYSKEELADRNFTVSLNLGQ